MDRMQEIRLRTRRGLGLRRAGAGRSRHVHTPDLSPAGLRSLVSALRSGEVAEPLPERACPNGAEGAEGADLDGLPVRRMAGVAEQAAAELERAGGPPVRGRAAIRVVRQHVLVATSEGRIAEERREYWSVRADAVARSGQKVRRSRRVQGARSLDDLCCGGAHLMLAAEVAAAALTRLDAVEGPSGELAVILAPGRPATLFHEVVGHGLEADHAAHPASPFRNRLGEVVAAPCVSVVDDPAPPGQPPLYSFDDEGQPGEATVLIEQGRLCALLHDRRTAAAQGARPNGHGRRLDHTRPALPRASATHVLAGDATAEEILAATPRGLLVVSTSGGDTDMGSGRFNLHVDEGWLVEGGRLTAPIAAASLSGSAREVLQSIDLVADDPAFVNLSYVCNKLEQFPLLVSVGQPTLRVRSLMVRGA